MIEEFNSCKAQEQGVGKKGCLQIHGRMKTAKEEC